MRKVGLSIAPNVVRLSLALIVVAGLSVTVARAAGQAPQPQEPARTVDPRPHDASAAIAFRRMSLVDKTGDVPSDGLMRAKAHADRMRAARRAPTTSVAGISKTSWTWRGPGNVGGRTRALAINPADPAIIFAGTAGGGIWKTTNAGASWTAVDDFMASLAVTALVYQPGSTTTLFAGTGEGFFNEDAIRGAGVFTSTDGGGTWTQLASTATADFFYVNRLAFSADGSILLAATRAGLFRSVDGGASWSGPGVSPANGATDVKFLPGSNTLAVAAGFDGTAYYSTTGGAAWTPSSLALGGPRTRIELATSASAPDNVYAVADVANGTLYKSTDCGVTYVVVSTPGHLADWGWYANAIWVSPVSDQTIVIGGLDLWRSTDGGAAFTRIGNWLLSHNADPHTIVSDPNLRVYVGSDGGVYKTDDVLTVETTTANVNGWVSLNNGFGPTQFYSVAGLDPYGEMVGGTQHNGTLLYGYPWQGTGTDWHDTSGSSGGFAAHDPNLGSLFYGEKSYLKVFRALNNPDRFYDISGVNSWNGPCEPAPHRIDDACDAFHGMSSANIVAPFILDPNDTSGQTMLAGGLSLWRSRDVQKGISTDRPSWIAIKAPIGASCDSGACISAIAVAPGNAAVIYVGHNNGDIYKTTNGAGTTPTWSRIDSAGMPDTQVQRIAVDPLNPNTVYAAFGGFDATNFWKSVDGGTTWMLAVGSGSTALPAAPVRGIAVNPVIAGYVYVGTEVGVFASEDGGATWVPDGPANVSVDELSWAVKGTVGTLIAATHGRGVYTTMPVGPTVTTTSAASASATFSTDAQYVDLSARVSSSGGGVVKTGYVTFTVRDATNAVVGSPARGEMDYLSNGTVSASFNIPAGTNPQTLTIAAAYSGTLQLSPSVDAAHTLVIGGSTRTSVSGAVVGFSTAAQSVPLSATVTSATGSVNMGTVTFTVRNAANAVVGVPVSGSVSNGSASASYVIPGGTTAQTLSITGSYSGVTNFAASTGTSTLIVGCPSIEIGPAAPPAARLGQPFSLTFWTTTVNDAVFSIGGAVPPGLTVSGATLSGTPSALGGFDILTTATSAASGGCGGTRTYSVRVMRPPSFVAGGGSGGLVNVFDSFGTATRSFIVSDGANFSGGVRVALGDMNGDGIADIVTAPGPGAATATVRVFDGGTGREIRRFEAYPSAAPAGLYVASADLNGDGIADVVTGHDGAPAEVRAFDGRTGLLMAHFVAYPSGGVRVAAGDLDADGIAEIITAPEGGLRPQVQVFSGSGTLRTSFNAYDPVFIGGVYVAAGDVDGDGHADIITGAGPGGGPHVRVFSGVDLHELRGFYAYTPSFAGGVRVAAGDLNLDGHADIITAAGPGGGPHVRVFDGASNSELFGLFAFDASFSGGVFVGAPTPLGRMVIDFASQTGPGQVRIAGWALREGTSGDGTDAIHVWAYPVGGGAPVFVAASPSRNARPDVAAYFGGEFLQSGFDFSGPLAPGTYDLVVFARNSVTGLFDQVRVIRITVN